MSEEIWAPVLEFSRYEVSNLGRVRRLPIEYNGVSHRGRPCKKRKGEFYPTIFLNKKGYQVVYLVDKKLSRPKAMTIHRLVAQAFLHNFSDDLVVDHLDGDKTNNHVFNLEMVTNKENLKRSHSYGTHSLKSVKTKRGLKKRRLTSEQVERIRELYFSLSLRDNSNKPHSTRSLAKLFNCHQPTIRDVVNKTGAYKQ